MKDLLVFVLIVSIFPIGLIVLATNHHNLVAKITTYLILL